MSGQRHIIKRQVIELKIRRSAQAGLYQDELSRIYRQRIIPLIERRCDELGKPDRLYRIEALDLDLGPLDPQNLEEDFTAKVDEALSRELARGIDACQEAARQSGGESETQSQLELFSFFARTGSLPWWAEHAHPGLLAENLEQLLRDAPEALSSLLRELTRESGPRHRMVNHYADEQLAALCGLLVSAYGQTIERDSRELLEALQALEPVTVDISRRFRQSLWNNFLLTTGMGGGQYATLEALYQAVLKRTAADPGGTGSELLTDLHRSIQDGRIKVNPRLSDAITALVERSAVALASAPGNERLARRLAELQAAGGPLSEAWQRLIALVPGLPARLQAELLVLLNDLPADVAGQAVAWHVLQLLESGIASQKVTGARAGPGAEMSGVIQIFRAVADGFNSSDHSELKLSAAAREEAVDMSFSETEALPIGNAGLVILWPFLGHFFTRLGLVDEDRRFKDLAARQRAAGLLQVIATQDASPPEYLLPLNKLLCGLELTGVFDFGPPLLDAEAEQCRSLLEAVIAQAPILHDMSVDGFRGTFLLRPGLLSTHDGMWLLHVEHQTYDVVLERFPWSWEWVRLSWMEAPLRVEW